MITLVLYIVSLPNLTTKNPIYFGVITMIPFDNLYRQAYFVMHTFLVIYGKMQLFSQIRNI